MTACIYCQGKGCVVCTLRRRPTVNYSAYGISVDPDEAAAAAKPTSDKIQKLWRKYAESKDRAPTASWDEVIPHTEHCPCHDRLQDILKRLSSLLEKLHGLDG